MSEQKIVILCGPDRCGKTQIAKALSQRLGAIYYKASGEHGNFLGKQDKFINELCYADPARLDLIKQSGMSIVFDRGFPCEYAYSRYFGRETDKSVLYWLDDEYSRLGAVIVFATRLSFAGIQDDLDPTIDSTQLNKISACYDAFMLRTKCRHLKLFVDDENLERELDEIDEFMNRKDAS